MVTEITSFPETLGGATEGRQHSEGETVQQGREVRRDEADGALEDGDGASQGSSGGATDERAHPEPPYQTDQVGGEAGRQQNISRLLGGGQDEEQVEGEPRDGVGVSEPVKARILPGGRFDL